MLERIADGLAMPDEARMRLGLAPKEVDFMKRRTALGLGLMATLSPSTLSDVLGESATEAFEFMRERAVRSVGRGALEHLAAVVAELDRAYLWRPATELFYTDQPGETTSAALKGLERVPRQHPLAARLRARATEQSALS